MMYPKYSFIKETNSIKIEFYMNPLYSSDEKPIIIEYRKIYENGDVLLHRDDGPAKIDGGVSYFYKNGKLHNEDGYAVKNKIMKGSQFNHYYFNGIKIETDSLQEFKYKIKLLSIE